MRYNTLDEEQWTFPCIVCPVVMVYINIQTHCSASPLVCLDITKVIKFKSYLCVVYIRKEVETVLIQINSNDVFNGINDIYCTNR